MNAISVHTSSSLSRLADTLAGTLSAAPLAPLAHETVVVLSPGMGRWLSMELAVRRGVCAGVDFRFPNDTVDACFRTVFPDLPTRSPFALDTMTWRIAGLLPDLLDLPTFAALASYLGPGGSDRRLLQLSRSLADTFDQYTIYRPEMILSWDRGSGSDWQALLWRRLTAGCEGLHRAALLDGFRRRLQTGSPPAGLPARISLFGISFLPPFHLEVLSLLARHMDVSIYLFTPCGDYWGDLFSEKSRASLALRSHIPAEALEFYETGNPLLSSLGTQGQEFFNLLLEYDVQWNSLDDDTDPSAASLLQLIQHDIRTLVSRGNGTPAAVIDEQDRSLTIHSCHGPLREMEILYDQLLAMFEELPDLEPRAVLVMTPDLATYAPYIRAVFGTSSGGRPPLPFTIADQSLRADSPLFETFLKILDLADSRFGINAILEILETPHVMARFDISPDEFGTLRNWLIDCGVRWGLDGDHRRDAGFPPYDDFSWQAGLDRLFLGYALEPDGDRLFNGRLPGRGVEGRRALLLGKLASFTDACRQVRQRLQARQSLAGWADTLAVIADLTTCPLDSNDTARTTLFSAFQQVRNLASSSGFEREIDREALGDLLEGILDSSAGGGGYLNGRITFCAMLPMRSIPQRVICLVGMNDGIFPRNPRQPGFSLLSGSRRRGDRSVRDEDRYLFLEALMSASERLYISYTGQSDRDNSVMPPSVVVAELQDYVKRGFQRQGQPDSSVGIVTRHRLQGFSPAYFGQGEQPGLFSYSCATRDALAERSRCGLSARVFQHRLLPEPVFTEDRIETLQLQRFFRNPTRVFLTERLKVHPYTPAGEIEEREPFYPDSLSAYTLRDRLVQRCLEGNSAENERALARAAGLLPPLASGDEFFSSLATASERFAGLISAHCTPELAPLTISLNMEGTHLAGTLVGIRDDMLLRWRCASLKASDRLALWIEHLLLNAVRPDGYPLHSRLICSDITLDLQPPDQPRLLLADLLSLYRDGLRRPLPFFPQSSFLCHTKGLESAAERWLGTDFGPYPAESSDPANQLCHAGIQVLDDEFAALADRIFAPLQAFSREEKTP